MTHPPFAGIGGHQHQRKGKEEWLTPPAVIAALGGPESFDLDPCAPIVRPWPTARAHFTVSENGLLRSWDPYPRIWLNPPYTVSKLKIWMGRMAAHNCGTALIFARTETDVWHRWVWACATAVFFFRHRLNFHHVDGSLALRKNGQPQNAGGPSALCAYGQHDAEILSSCGLTGQFIPLRLPRFIVAAALAPTWRAAIAEWFSGQVGPVALADVYRAFANHPKARGNRNYQAKIRQQLQTGPYRRVRRGEWSAA